MIRSSRALRVPLFYLRQTNIFPATRKRIMNPILECSAFSFLHNISNTTPFCTSTGGNHDPPEHALDATDEECDEKRLVNRDQDILRDVERIVGIFSEPGISICQAKSRLEEVCDVKVKSEVVFKVVLRLRNNWEAAFTFFLWARKQSGYEHSVRVLHVMILILGKRRKLYTAWALIDEMRGIKTGRNLVTPQTLLIMIKKCSAVGDMGKAISTFYAYKKFKIHLRLAEFQTFLSALCRYKNVKDAEDLMFANTDVYPLDTKSCNIVLNGWCNVVGDLREGNRFWVLMKERKIKGDSYSYASIMTGFSKGFKRDVVFKLFNEMKELGVEPDIEVYNAVIHALAKGMFLKEARHLMETMEAKGVSPNNVTYYLLMLPFCNDQLDTAKELFNEMIERGICPTLKTFHALFHVLNTEEEVFELLQRMHSISCHPTHDTYLVLIKKFCQLRQIDNVYKIWNEMSKNGLAPGRSTYTFLIDGLFVNGRMAEAHQYYLEMIKKNFQPEPKVEKMIQAYLAGKQETESHMTGFKSNPAESDQHGDCSL